MAAVIVPTTSAPAPWHRPPVTRPQLRVLPGGPAAVRARRRRSVRPGAAIVTVGLAMAVVVALALVGFAHLLGADAAAPGPASTAQSPPVVAAPSAVAPGEGSASSDRVVVGPGDTLWSIARSLQPSGDVRPLVDRLAERAGGPVLTVGQRIDVTDLG